MRSDILTVKLYPYFMTGTLKNLIMWENHLEQIYQGSFESTLVSPYLQIVQVCWHHRGVQN